MYALQRFSFYRNISRFNNSLRSFHLKSSSKHFSEIYNPLYSKTVAPTKKTLATPQNAPIPPNQQVVDPSQIKKTPQELNTERLLSELPEYIKNPKDEITKDLRNQFEQVFKYHTGDKNYIKTNDLPIEIYLNVNNEFFMAHTTETIADVFKMHEGYLTDQAIASKFNQICFSHKDLTKEFYDVIVPEVKKVLKKADKGSEMTLYFAITAAANINLGDKEFWEIINQKMVNEKLYRQLTLENSIAVAVSLCLSNRKNDTLLKQLEIQFIRFRKQIALDPNSQKAITAAFAIAGKGSELLFEAMKNPNIEIPSLEPKRLPRMDKPINAQEAEQKLLGH